MDNIKRMITMLDHILDTGRKRHIIGGVLLSTSIMFGGLALTTFTIKKESDNDEQ